MSDDDDFITIDRVCREFGGSETPLNKATIYKGMKEGRYPKPVKVGSASRWLLSEVRAAKRALVEARA